VSVHAASGRQLQLRRATLAATVTEVGAGLRELTSARRPLIQSYGADEIATYGHGQVLLPWPNRVAGGAYDFGGRRLQLPLSEPEAGNAIHGLARWVPWRILVHERDRAVLALVVHPQAGYPFRLAVRVEYRLEDDGLRVLTSARNAGTDPLPFGCGFHPYLTVGTQTIDEALLTLPASTRLEVDARGVPTGARLPVSGTAWDFRSARAIGDLSLDTAFGDLHRDGDGAFHVTLQAPGTPHALDLWADASYRYVMAFTGDALPGPRRRRALAVEPMTCAPDALRSGDGLLTLAPGESHESEWGLRIG
jgi:aldose 1-epimerase